VVQRNSGVASPEFFWGKIVDFRRATACCLECHLSKHKMTRYAKTLGAAVALAPPGYSYAAKKRFMQQLPCIWETENMRIL